MSTEKAISIINQWADQGLKNIRFSGGEPTLHKGLAEMVRQAKERGIERIAISTNGSNKLDLYKELIEAGVNDFSISLDACCGAFGDKMAGVAGYFDTVKSNIAELSKITYVTVGIVVTPDNVSQLKEIVDFADGLGVNDIRIVPAAQWDDVTNVFSSINDELLEKHPILKYRVQNMKNGRGVRGLTDSDEHRCHLIKDDMAICGNFHFPCIIYMREQGKPIGVVGPNMRQERKEWSENHNTYDDPICKKNCLDVCIDFNNRCAKLKKQK
jgi:molybdenum cofactor biosynthesis enzyme MoaA